MKRQIHIVEDIEQFISELESTNYKVTIENNELYKNIRPADLIVQKSVFNSISEYIKDDELKIEYKDSYVIDDKLVLDDEFDYKINISKIQDVTGPTIIADIIKGIEEDEFDIQESKIIDIEDVDDPNLIHLSITIDKLDNGKYEGYTYYMDEEITDESEYSYEDCASKIIRQIILIKNIQIKTIENE